MIKLHVIQARFGDCFLLEYGEEDSKFILMDGGPAQNYANCLRPVLEKLTQKDQVLEAAIITHIDNDHIVGILDLIADIKFANDNNSKPFLGIRELWFNSFSATCKIPRLEKRVNEIKGTAGATGAGMQAMSAVVNGVKEGSQVIGFSRALKIPVNPAAPAGFHYCEAGNPPVNMSNLTITVLGPTKKNLEKLKLKWEEWIQKNEDKIRDGQYTAEFAAAMDRSVPNLSSIVLLIEANGRSLLMTGDCLGDDVIDGLKEMKLSADGKYHVNILKVPHHGSKRNTKENFYALVTADIYVISADGTKGNPDEEVLSWIVESAHRSGRSIRLVFTNQTPSLEAFLKKYDPTLFGFVIQVLGKGEKYLTIE